MTQTAVVESPSEGAFAGDYTLKWFRVKATTLLPYGGVCLCTGPGPGSTSVMTHCSQATQ